MVGILTAIQRIAPPVASSFASLFNRQPFATTLCRTYFRDLGLSPRPSGLWETRSAVGGIVGVKSEYMLSVVAPDRRTPPRWPPHRLLRPYHHGLTMKALSLPKRVVFASQNANVREIPVKAVKLVFESFTSNAVLGPQATNLDEVTIGRAV